MGQGVSARGNTGPQGGQDALRGLCLGKEGNGPGAPAGHSVGPFWAGMCGIMRQQQSGGKQHHAREELVILSALTCSCSHHC